jgi:hypothetical protein
MVEGTPDPLTPPPPSFAPSASAEMETARSLSPFTRFAHPAQIKTHPAQQIVPQKIRFNRGRMFIIRSPGM